MPAVGKLLSTIMLAHLVEVLAHSLCVAIPATFVCDRMEWPKAESIGDRAHDHGWPEREVAYLAC